MPDGRGDLVRFPEETRTIFMGKKATAGLAPGRAKKQLLSETWFVPRQSRHHTVAMCSSVNQSADRPREVLLGIRCSFPSRDRPYVPVPTYRNSSTTRRTPLRPTATQRIVAHLVWRGPSQRDASMVPPRDVLYCTIPCLHQPQAWPIPWS